MEASLEAALVYTDIEVSDKISKYLTTNVHGLGYTRAARRLIVQFLHRPDCGAGGPHRKSPCYGEQDHLSRYDHGQRCAYSRKKLRSLRQESYSVSSRHEEVEADCEIVP